MRKTLIVGLGNPILGDDGIGWRVAEELRRQLLPPGVEIDQLASGGISLMERLVGYDAAIVVDAMRTGRYPLGSVHSFRLEQLENSFAGHLGSPHETNLATALDLGRDLGAELPKSVMVVAVEAEQVYDFSEQLSPVVEAAVDPAIQVVLALLQRFF